MAITFVDSVKRETTASSIKVTDVTVSAGDMLIATVGYASAEAPKSCFFGTDGEDKFERTGQRVDTTNGFGVTTFISRRFINPATAEVDVDWVSDIGARVLIVYKITDSHYTEDQIARNLMTASADPHTSYSEEHAYRDSLAWVALCSNGPEADTAPIWETGWSIGERKGTSLITADTDNITVYVGYQELAAADPARGRATGATVRNWSNTLSILRPANYPVLDEYEYELNAGDSVIWNRGDGETYVISSIERIMGTFGILKLTNGENIQSYDCLKVV